MKLFAIIFMLLFGSGAYSQCSEFNNLLKKGDDFLKGKKPNYSEAINAYTAAIIACSERADEAQQRISRMVNDINKLKEKADNEQTKAIASKLKSDSLYVEAEKQKNVAIDALNLAQVMGDSASQAGLQKQLAQEKLGLLIILNDYETLGDQEAEKQNYDNSINYYSQALSKIDSQSTLDAATTAKMQVLKQKKAIAFDKLESQVLLKNCIRISDSLLKSGVYNFHTAYENYLNKKNKVFDNDALKQRVALMEDYLEDNWKSIQKESKGINDFGHVLITSFEGNIFLGRIAQAKNRIKQSMIVLPLDSILRMDLTYKNYDEIYIGKFIRRLSFYSGARYNLTSRGYSLEYKLSGYNKTSIYSFNKHKLNEVGFFVGTKINVFKSVSIGIEYCKIRQQGFNRVLVDFNNSNNLLQKEIYHFTSEEKRYDQTHRFSFLTYVQINKKPSFLNFQFIGGIEYFHYQNTYNEIGVDFVDSVSIPKFNNADIFTYVYGGYKNRYNYIFSQYNDSPNVYAGFYYIDTSKGYARNLNLVTGGRLVAYPFWKEFSEISIFLDILKPFTLSPNFKKINNIVHVKKNIYDSLVVNNFDATEAANYTNKYWDYDIEFRTKRSLTQGLNFRIGLGYRF